MKKRSPSGAAFFLPAVLLLFSLSSCRSEEAVEIELGIFSSSPWGVPSPHIYRFYDESIAAYRERNSSVEIKPSYGVTREAYSEWLSQKVLYAQEPDIFLVLPDDLSIFAAIGLLEPLGSLVDDPVFRNGGEWYENVLSSGRFNGIQYAMPVQLDPEVMFVNKTLLSEAGEKMPDLDWTWDDFYEICSRITRDTDGDGKFDRLGEQDFSWLHAVYTNGENLFNELGTEALLEKPEILEAFEFWTRLKSLGGRVDPELFDFNRGNVVFIPASVSTYRAYATYPYNLRRYADFDWDVTVLPKGPEGSNAVNLKAVYLAVSSRSSHKREAKEFLRYLVTDKRVQLRILDYDLGLPARREVLELAEARKLLTRNLPIYKRPLDMEIIRSTVENSINVPRFRNYGRAVEFIDHVITTESPNLRNLQSFLNRLDLNVTEFLLR